jgi:tRNA pseudouridine55 synthase
MDGFFVIDKPVGITSHGVVSAVRRIIGQKKVGHTGTLDPFATGVLPVAVGEGTKAIPFLDESTKEYRAVMRLGEATDTQDCEGAVLKIGKWEGLTVATIEETCREFTGRLSQLPPMFSALKRNGVPLYRLARQGIEVERESREIEVFSLTPDRIEPPEVEFTVRCSRGTYVRTLAADMGEKLGCGAHLTKLRRTVSGPFSLQQAISLDRLHEAFQEGTVSSLLISPYEALGHLRAVELTMAGAAKVNCGVTPTATEFAQQGLVTAIHPLERFRLARGMKLLAVAEYPPMRLLRVFN